MKTSTFLLGTALFLAGCAGNPYEKFYQVTPGATPEDIAQRRLAPAPEVPEMLHGSDPKTDVQAQLADGYSVIGISSFHGPQARDRDALKQAESVGADRVLAYSQYTRTTQTEVPITLPTTQTSITNGSATAFGTGGMATAYGTALTTSYGSQTTFVPMSIDQYDFLAVYLVKVRQAFGAFYRNLNPQESQDAGSVNGVVLTVVVHGSSAATAGFLPGDLVRTVDGSPVADVQEFNTYLKQKQGQRVTITVKRNGRTIDLPLTLGSLYSDPNSPEAQTQVSETPASFKMHADDPQPSTGTEIPQSVASSQTSLENASPSDATARPACSPQERELAQMAKKNGYQYSGQCADSGR